MGVDVMDPEGRREESMAESLEAFSSFVLGDEGREACASIIDRHMDGSAGELQGGSEEHSVYRVTIGDGEDGEKGVGGAEVRGLSASSLATTPLLPPPEPPPHNPPPPSQPGAR